MKRFLSAITALIILTLSLTSLFGCAKSTSLLKIDPTEDEKRVVGRIGDFDVYYDELRYITLTYKEQMENKYGEGIWKDAQSAAPYIDELSKNLDVIAERVKESEEERLAVNRLKTAMLTEVEMLYDIFMHSSLPQYSKDNVGEKISAMKKALGTGEENG